VNARETTEALLSQLGSNDDINFLLRGFAASGAKEENGGNVVKGGDECQALRLENQALKQVSNCIDRWELEIGLTNYRIKSY
jgi:hypothetical protein